MNYMALINYWLVCNTSFLSVYSGAFYSTSHFFLCGDTSALAFDIIYFSYLEYGSFPKENFRLFGYLASYSPKFMLFTKFELNLN